MDALQEQINFWNGYGVQVNWFVNADRTEAIAIGRDFAWSVKCDGSTFETMLVGWSTGIEI